MVSAGRDRRHLFGARVVADLLEIAAVEGSPA
jgi:hypothetical protein